VRICGTIVSPAGKPTHRQPALKTAKSMRKVSVPTFTAEVLREPLVKTAIKDLSAGSSSLGTARR
jgi:hypothetical protein